MEYLRVGNIVNTFGIKGELKVKSLSDFQQERFKKDQQLYIKYHDEYIAVIVNSYRLHKGFVLVSFKDLLDINLVEKYKNCDIFISKDDISLLAKGEYYFFQLRGCQVYHDNQLIGEVTAVEGQYQTLLRIQGKDKEVLIPYVASFIKSVDIQANRIDIDVIEGLL
ncbi:MAG: ribosome maturation factor RimM [Erysipelotrichaceae bacterium]